MSELLPILELFTIDLTIFGDNIYCFHPYNTDDEITFNGKTYLAMPIEADGFELTNKGLPLPKITVSNIFGTMSSLIDTFDGLQGAKVTRTKVQSHAPPHNYYNSDVIGSPDIYVIDRPTSETKLTVTFELRSIFDLSSLKLPRRTILQSRCSWVYKSSECGYIGILPTCDRDPNDCLIHFQNMTGQVAPILNYAGFTGIDRYPN